MKVCQKDMKLWFYMGVLLFVITEHLAQSLSVIYSLKGVQLLYIQLHEKCTYLNCTSLGIIDLS